MSKNAHVFIHENGWGIRAKAVIGTLKCLCNNLRFERKIGVPHESDSLYGSLDEDINKFSMIIAIRIPFINLKVQFETMAKAYKKAECANIRPL